MKDTGIIRRIDDLGRIVIPKEIRKKLKIDEGEKIEIFINNEQIILQKYSDIVNIKDIADAITDAIYTIIKKTVIITDNEYIIAISGNNKKELLNKKISNDLYEIIKKRNDAVLNNINIVDKYPVSGKLSLIKENGDTVGTIIVIGDITKEIEKIMEVNTIFLNKYLEE